MHVELEAGTEEVGDIQTTATGNQEELGRSRRDKQPSIAIPGWF